MTRLQKQSLIQRYFELNQEKKRIEKECAELNKQIKESVKPGSYGDLIVNYVVQERSCFDWKKARDELSYTVLAKLDAFWKRTTVYNLYVGRKDELPITQSVIIGVE